MTAESIDGRFWTPHERINVRRCQSVVIELDLVCQRWNSFRSESFADQPDPPRPRRRPFEPSSIAPVPRTVIGHRPDFHSNSECVPPPVQCPSTSIEPSPSYEHGQRQSQPQSPSSPADHTSVRTNLARCPPTTAKLQQPSSFSGATQQTSTQLSCMHPLQPDSPSVHDVRPSSTYFRYVDCRPASFETRRG